MTSHFFTGPLHCRHILLFALRIFIDQIFQNRNADGLDAAGQKSQEHEQDSLAGVDDPAEEVEELFDLVDGGQTAKGCFSAEKTRDPVKQLEDDIRKNDFSAPSYYLKVDYPEQYSLNETKYIPAGNYACFLIKIKGGTPK